MKFKFNCSARPFRTFDVSFDPESESTCRILYRWHSIRCRCRRLASLVLSFRFRLVLLVLSFPSFPSLPSFPFSLPFFLTFPHNVQQGMTLQRIENIENQIDLFSSFSSFSSSSSSSSSSFSCQLFQGHRNPHSKIEEPQLQSCQAMSSLIFCFG